MASQFLSPRLVRQVISQNVKAQEVGGTRLGTRASDDPNHFPGTNVPALFKQLLGGIHHLVGGIQLGALDRKNTPQHGMRLIVTSTLESP